MPKRTDLKKIMIIGSGPIVIGQGCEFDYSGTQGVKVLKEEGYEVVLVNSNPATIMTDPGLADRTYIEPVEPESVAAIVRKERPCAILPTLGGQTALNTALSLAHSGLLDELGIELIGASPDVIEKAESRKLFRQAMQNIDLAVPSSYIINDIEEVKEVGKIAPFPLIVRPAFTLGGAGGGIAYNLEDLQRIVADGLARSLTGEVLVEQSVLGYKEFEMEVMRDNADNCVIVCSIENLDAMGVHTGDSITVAPAQTLTDKDYQKMRNASLAIMREIGVETGGSNVQFGINPKNGDMVVIEMNPRVSRSSALASKATGFPIAKIATKLAIGYRLDEIQNDITKETVASFEPTLDYCVVKLPRFAFEKFPLAIDELTTSMKSVGEAMSIGRTFKEALQKGLRSLEVGATGFVSDEKLKASKPEELIPLLKKPSSGRIFVVRQALLSGMSVEEIYEHSAIDPWFLRQMQDILQAEADISGFALANSLSPSNPEMVKTLSLAKSYGFSDRQIATMWKKSPADICALRKKAGILPTFYQVDTCAAEFEAYTPYFYSTHEHFGGQTQCLSDDDETKKKVIILGGGPNRIGQGVEFDYCCCHAAFALKEMGIISIMVNSNPETVSTDYDTSDKLYFEPLSFEDVYEVIAREKPDGVIVQFGGQTPLNLALALQQADVPILGTDPDAIDRAEDRERFQALLDKLKLKQAPCGVAFCGEEARKVAENIGYPVVVRPSYVLGGRAMQIVYSDSELAEYFQKHVGNTKLEHPILVDKFLQKATELDVDALSDGTDVYVAGIMEHIEEAGIHSGDSACVLPPYSLSQEIIDEISRQTVLLAKELHVIGLMNIQFAVKNGEIFILEVNPRASRTVPFVAKATAVPLANMATRVILGEKLKDLKPWELRREGYVAVKEAVFPFKNFPGVDIILGPEMRSTGEVMGIADNLEEAFIKSQKASGQHLPKSGKVFISVKDGDKAQLPELAGLLESAGYELLATQGTANFLRDQGLTVATVLKVHEGRPHIVDMIKNGEIALVINTVAEGKTVSDSKSIREATLHYGVAYTTTMPGAKIIARAITDKNQQEIRVKSLQEYYQA